MSEGLHDWGQHRLRTWNNDASLRVPSAREPIDHRSLRILLSDDGVLMRAQLGFAILAATFATACAPLESVRIQDDVIKSKTVVGAGHDPVVTVAVQAAGDGGAFVVRSHETCEQNEEDLHLRTRYTERHSDTTTTAALYGLGGLGTVIGGIVVGDASNVPSADDPKTVNPLGRSGAYAIGTGLLAVGVPLLGAAIVTSLRARDSVKGLGNKWETRSDSAVAMKCNEKPASKVEVVVLGASTRISLGKTTSKGRLTFTWDTLETLFQTDEPPDTAMLEVRGAGAGRLDLAAGKAFFAGREIEEATRLAADDEVDKAAVHLSRAKALGAEDIAAAQAAIDRAPTSVARVREAENKAKAERATKQKKVDDHLARAREFIRRDVPDKADTELTAAEALGAATTELREALANTPTEKKKRREQERLLALQERQRRAEKERQSQLVKTSLALRQFCELAAERAQDFLEMNRSRSDECGQSSGEPDSRAYFMQCQTQYYSIARRIDSRYEVLMTPLRDKAARQIKRLPTNGDCCEVLPSRFRHFGDQCIPAR